MPSKTPTAEIQYVYIPNLLGRQMLRVPLEVESYVTPAPSLKLNTAYALLSPRPTLSRTVSPTVSIESVSDEE